MGIIQKVSRIIELYIHFFNKNEKTRKMLQINRWNCMKLRLLNYLTNTFYTVISRHIGPKDKTQQVFTSTIEYNRVPCSFSVEHIHKIMYKVTINRINGIKTSPT